MKRSLLLAICLSVVSAFAGAYDIDEFNAKEKASPDEYITAEFGGKLKVAPADEVESLQSGRLVVRQKFVDPFGDGDATYQLFQGAAGDLSSMTALSADGVDYSKLVSAKLYKRKGMKVSDDVEKVYFDGKSVYAPGLSSAIVFIDGVAVSLKASESAAASDDEDSDEATETAAASSYDEDCDDDEDCDEDLSKYRTNAPIDESADGRDYAAGSAASDITDRFGIADEVRFWTAVGLSALAAASIVLGITQHSSANKAQDAYDELNSIYTVIMKDCNGNKVCEDKVLQSGQLSMKDDYGEPMLWTVKDLKSRINTNKKTHDSYATARNLWFGLAGASIAGAVVLFVW